MPYPYPSKKEENKKPSYYNSPFLKPTLSNHYLYSKLLIGSCVNN